MFQTFALIYTVVQSYLLQNIVSLLILLSSGFIPVIIELILHEESKHHEKEKQEDSNPPRKIDIKRVFLSDLMLLLNHNHSNCR